MLSRLQALYAWLHTHEGRKIFRYTMVSVISTAVSLSSSLLVYGVLHLWSEVPSTIFGNVVATFPSYWLNRKWAWGKSGRSHFWKEVVPFWILAAVGIAFSILGAALARHIAIKYNLDHVEPTRGRAGGQRHVVRHLLGRSSCCSSTSSSTIELEEFDEHLTHEEEEEADPRPTPH